MKTSIDFAYFGLESGMVFDRTTGVYEVILISFQFQMTTGKKEKYENSKWILRNLFLLLF